VSTHATATDKLYAKPLLHPPVNRHRHNAIVTAIHNHPFMTDLDAFPHVDPRDAAAAVGQA
jgi:hypothetical protein